MRLLLALLLCAVVHGNGVRAQAAWPEIPLPRDARPFPVGDKLVHNGMPMRLKGFTAAAPVEELAEWFRRRLGQPLVENRVGENLVLGKANGDYYLTVQLVAAGHRTRGVAAVAHLKGQANEDVAGAGGTRWRQRLPAGTEIVSQLASEDKGRRSLHLIAINDQSEEANAETLIASLRGDGLQLERASRVADAPASPQASRLGDARLLFFKGAGKEGMATVARNREGRTVIVLNTISSSGADR